MPLEIISTTLYPSKSIFTCRKFPRTVFSQVLGISTEKDTTTSWRNLFQCSPTLTVSKCFLVFRQTSMCFNLNRLSQGTVKSLSFCFSFPWASLLQAEQSQAFPSFLKWKMPQSPDSLCGLHWTHSLFKPCILNFDLDQS